jgi:hypothetical protein
VQQQEREEREEAKRRERVAREREAQEAKRREGTQFTCFYWHKSTNTDAGGAAEEAEAKAAEEAAGTQFITCFTGTKVQILTQQALQRRRGKKRPRNASSRKKKKKKRKSSCGRRRRQQQRPRLPRLRRRRPLDRRERSVGSAGWECFLRKPSMWQTTSSARPHVLLCFAKALQKRNNNN